jgi:hypothetical protein
MLVSRRPAGGSGIHSPVSEELKLPRAKSQTSRGQTNEWMAADRRETWKIVGLVLFFASILAAGAWLIFSASSR